MLRSTTAAGLTIVLIGLAGCGDDDGADGADATRSAAGGNVERYCALTRELDTVGEQFFAKLARKKDATPADYEAAERLFIETHESELDAIERSAPRKVKADVETLLEGQRVRAGLEPASTVSEVEASAAEERVLEFEKRSCTGR